MTIKQLVELQKAGNFKVSKENSLADAIVGGYKLSTEMCDNMATKLGWTARKSLPSWKLIDKTNTYVKAFNRYLGEKFNNFDVLFENIGLIDSDKTMDRVVISSEKNGIIVESYTIIHGMSGIGGSYALFIAKQSQTHPVISSRTIKSVLEYIDTDRQSE